MKHFRLDNTEGFDEYLEDMNNALDALLACRFASTWPSDAMIAEWIHENPEEYLQLKTRILMWADANIQAKEEDN